MSPDSRPRWWVDPFVRVVVFRGDVTIEEARQVQDVIRDAYNQGLRAGWDQAVAACGLPPGGAGEAPADGETA